MKKKTRELSIIILSLVLVVVLFWMVGKVTLLFAGKPEPGKEDIELWRLQVVMYGGILSISSLGMGKFLLKRKLGELGIIKPRRSDLKIGIAIGIIDLLGAFLITWCLWGIASYLQVGLSFEKAGWMAAYNIRGVLDFFTIMIPSFILVLPAEELFYRGFVLGTFLKHMRPTLAISLSALIWAVHQMAPGIELWYAAVSAAFIGLVHGYVYLKKRSLFPLIIAHSTYLLIVILLFSR